MPKTAYANGQRYRMWNDTSFAEQGILLLKNIYKKLFCKYYLIGQNCTKYCYLVYHFTKNSIYFVLENFVYRTEHQMNTCIYVTFL